MKLEEVLSAFLKLYINSPHTHRSYEQTCDRLMNALGSKRRLETITKIDLINFVADLEKEDLAPATIYRHKKVVKRIFSWLYDEMEAIESNPATVIHQQRLDKRVPSDKAMTDEELEKILDYLKYRPQYLAIVHFLADTGCRAGGAAKLKIDKLNIKKREADVIEKGNKLRTVWFSNDCAAALRSWLLMRPHTDHNFVFCHANGPYTSAAISQIIRRSCKALGLRSLGAHSIRHWFAFRLADNGVQPSVAARVLGHSDVMTTLTHYYPSDLKRAEEAARNIHIKASEHEKKILRFNREG